MKKMMVIMLIVEIIASAAGWFLLFTYTRWELAVGILLLMFGNNIMIARRMFKATGKPY